MLLSATCAGRRRHLAEDLEEVLLAARPVVRPRGAAAAVPRIAQPHEHELAVVAHVAAVRLRVAAEPALGTRRRNRQHRDDDRQRQDDAHVCSSHDHPSQPGPKSHSTSKFGSRSRHASPRERRYSHSEPISPSSRMRMMGMSHSSRSSTTVMPLAAVGDRVHDRRRRPSRRSSGLRSRSATRCSSGARIAASKYSASLGATRTVSDAAAGVLAVARRAADRHLVEPVFGRREARAVLAVVLDRPVHRHVFDLARRRRSPAP